MSGKAPVFNRLLTREELEKLPYALLQKLCQERNKDFSASKEALVESLVELNKIVTSESSEPNDRSQESSLTDLAELQKKVDRLDFILEGNEASAAYRLTDVERRLTALEHINANPKTVVDYGGRPVTLTDLAMRVEQLETLVRSMPVDLNNTIGKLKWALPPSGFMLEHRIAALESMFSKVGPVPHLPVTTADVGFARGLGSLKLDLPFASQSTSSSSAGNFFLQLPVPQGAGPSPGIDTFQNPSGISSPNPFRSSPEPPFLSPATAMVETNLIAPRPRPSVDLDTQDYAWVPQRPTVSPLSTEFVDVAQEQDK